VLERARRELGLEDGEVAVVGSWPKVALAAERTAGAVAVSVGFAPLRLLGDEPDGVSEALAAAAVTDPPPWPYRRDRHTWAMAMHHLERAHPRLLWISLGDPDEWAHLDEYRAYAAAVRELDDRLAGLFEQLAAMGEYGEGASVLVTTDHGRGAGDAWSGHGRSVPGSELAWLFASTPATRAAGGRSGGGRYDHGSIRPTLEALLGLTPCPGCQAPIAELLPPAWTAQAEGPAAGAGGP
jgi:arylsulfatase A-like enzyme